MTQKIDKETLEALLDEAYYQWMTTRELMDKLQRIFNSQERVMKEIQQKLKK